MCTFATKYRMAIMKKLFMIGMLALVAVSGWAQEQFQGMF